MKLYEHSENCVEQVSYSDFVCFSLLLTDLEFGSASFNIQGTREKSGSSRTPTTSRPVGQIVGS